MMNGRDRDRAQEERAAPGDADEDALDVLLGRPPGPDARDEAALPLEVLGQVLLLEDDDRVEEREDDDGHEHERPVARVVRARTPTAGSPRCWPQRCCSRWRDALPMNAGRMTIEKREDERDHAGAVDRRGMWVWPDWRYMRPERKTLREYCTGIRLCASWK